jgi:hypothetical protein
MCAVERTIRVVGEAANVELLRQTLVADPVFGQEADIAVIPVAPGGEAGKLRYGELLEIVIAVSEALGSQALFEFIKAAIERARQRGAIEVSDTGEEDKAVPDAADPETGDSGTSA